MKERFLKDYCVGYQSYYQGAWLQGCPFKQKTRQYWWQAGWQDANLDPYHKNRILAGLHFPTADPLKRSA